MSDGWCVIINERVEQKYFHAMNIIEIVRI